MAMVFHSYLLFHYSNIPMFYLSAAFCPMGNFQDVASVTWVTVTGVSSDVSFVNLRPYFSWVNMQ